MTKPALGLVGLLLLVNVPLWLVGCTVPAYAPDYPAPAEMDYSPSSGRNYGAGGGRLSAQQLATLRGLAWPQTRTDMIGTFGYPGNFDGGADYYYTPEGQTVIVYYSGQTATGYSIQ